MMMMMTYRRRLRMEAELGQSVEEDGAYRARLGGEGVKVLGVRG
jgi:hypothetical protein